MRNFSRSLHMPLVLAAFAMMGITACQKNEAGVTIPQVVDPVITNGKDTIYLGDSLKLSPALSNIAGTPIYQWMVNGTIVSTDSSFLFKPTERGDYTISYRVTAGNAQSPLYYRIKVLEPFENGYLIVNEGNYPGLGSVNFYRNGDDTMMLNVYSRINPGKTLGTTTEYGAIHNNVLYMVSKQGAFVAANAFSLKETGRIASLPAEGHAFLGVDNSRGLVSTADGIYQVNLPTFTLGAKVAGISGEAGGMTKTDSYIFVLTQNDGVVVLNISDFSIVAKPVKADVGFAKSQDGRVWAGTGTNLYAIDGSTLAVKAYTVPFTIYDSWGFWNPGSFSGSKYENAIYFAQTGQYGGGTNIYKFVPGIDTTLTVPLVKLPADKELYGAGVRFNSRDTTLVVTAMKPGYGTNSQQNTLLIYNAINGTLKKSIDYTGYFFPAMPVSN